MDAVTRLDCRATRTSSTPDLVVIGAGSAGFSAAIRASELGATVALIGDGTIGGTCVNVGCVPSKTLIRAAEALHRAHSAGRFAGISGGCRLDDWATLIAQKDRLVADLRGAKYQALLPDYEAIRYIPGRARFAAAGIEAAGTMFPADRVVIATGALAAVPTIPGMDEVPYLTSTAALALDALPASLLIIGGGVIGCELGQMFARFGVGVTIVCRTRLLPGSEPEISDALAGYLRDEGITIRDDAQYRAIRRSETGIALDLTIEDRTETIDAARVLVATGRCANTDTMGFEAAGIALDRNGSILTDDYLATRRPGTYAAGDVTGRDQYVYMAAYGAKLAAENALNGNVRRYDARAMPEVVFTDPQMASVGMTEAEAKRQGYEVRTVRLDLALLPRALAARDTRGLIKLVAQAGNLRLLGAHILAPEGADSIQTAALAIRHNLTVTDLADTLFPYLTTVEGLKLASLGFQKDVAKLSCCAG
ncbi:mercury(II) reductase [Acidiphilium acidophilum]|uniref:mercury(II) reductase n=1 Tax=Acidiphilium acidophilum TaxID=76588 RepID=UPI002E8E764B|nr:mercury(II) reductase [Acidiphilium acidophilum]